MLFNFLFIVAPKLTTSEMLTNRRKRSYMGPPIVPTEAPVYCDRFVQPITDNNTFFSPLDPRSATNTYPPNADCTFVLEGE